MRPRGRRRGPPTVPFLLRLTPDQKSDLEFLRGFLDGAPPINGLIKAAVDRYITAKLADPDIRAAHERRANYRLQVVRDVSGGTP